MSSSERTPRPDSAHTHLPKAVARPVASDRFSTPQSAQLHAALEAQPEVRPEVVARGRALAADPSWPTPAVITKVGQAILNSPDLSEDQS